MVGDLHIRIAKLAFHAKESPIRTRDEVFNLVSSRSRSPAEGIVWLSGHPLIQDSLKRYRSTSKVHLRRGRTTTFGRNSCWTWWPPRRSSGPCKQGLPYMFLLADGPSSCAGPCSMLRLFCQLFANQSHMPPTALQIIPITWPFAV